MAGCEYTRSSSIGEVMARLADADGEAHVIAGGIALGILMNEKLVDPVHLIDITQLSELRGIEETASGLRIGALTTHSEIESSPLVHATLPVLAEIAAGIACDRIKNRGTIGGNICLADPQSDMPVAALAFRAQLKAVGRNGARDVPATSFFVGLYETALEEGELLQEVVFPQLPEHTGVAFGKFGARKAMDYSSTVAVAIRVTIDPGDETIREIGIGFGGLDVLPLWPKKTEAVFAGKRVDAAILEAARTALAEECDPIEDDLYSAEFKLHVAGVIMRRTMEAALMRARSTTNAGVQD